MEIALITRVNPISKIAKKFNKFVINELDFFI